MKSSTSKSNGSQNGTKAASKTARKSDPKVAQGLRDLFEDELKDIYWAEKALTKAIPKMAKNATSEELVSALNDHLEVTKGHVQRLEETFKILGKAARAKKCEAMAGLVKEAEEIMEDTEEGAVRDAGIISAGQKVEHYEIATYGTLVTFAKTLGEDEVASLLHQTLEEEKEADEKLTEIAESSINVEAEQA
ncbi:MAG: ferritin-like domain-containing protein [Ginsengibacter sp.]